MIHNFHLRRTPRHLSGIGMPKMHQTKKSEGLSYLKRIFYFHIVFHDYQKPFYGQHISREHEPRIRDARHVPHVHHVHIFFKNSFSFVFQSILYII